MAERIRIRKAEGNWVIRAGGAVLGESTNALELTEGDYAPVIYFPREDVAMAFLEKTDHSTSCPHKGTASYFNVVLKSTTIKDGVWSYEAPVEGAERIANHLAFYPENITVEQV